MTQFQREKERGWYHEEQSTVDSGPNHATAGPGHRRVTSNGHFYFVLLTNALVVYFLYTLVYWKSLFFLEGTVFFLCFVSIFAHVLILSSQYCYYVFCYGFTFLHSPNLITSALFLQNFSPWPSSLLFLFVLSLISLCFCSYPSACPGSLYLINFLFPHLL